MPPQRPRKYVQWGVKWHRQPLLMLLFALASGIFSIGHHFLYSVLGGTRAGSDHRQQWAHAFGNALAILVITSLAAANRAVYKQYIWTIVRRKSLSLRSLDGLFSLTSDPLGFFNLETMRHAPLAVILAFLCWIIPLAGLLPPGSLVVIHATTALTEKVSIPSLAWAIKDPSRSANSWNEATGLGISQSMEVIAIATRAAEDMTILDMAAPASNSSYELTIRGPYVLCDEANSSQIPVFEYYKTAAASERMITSYTEADIAQNFSRTSPYFGIVLSIFDPFLGNDGWTSGTAGGVLGSWSSFLPPDIGKLLGYIPHDLENLTYCKDNITYTHCQMFPRQLWVNTANDSFVCTLGNATRTAQFSFIDGKQSVVYGDLQNFEPVFVPMDGSLRNSSGGVRLPVNFEAYSYMAVYQSLAQMLIGNVTLVLGNSSQVLPEIYHGSKVLTTGLQACEEFSNSYWTQKYPSNKYLFDESGSTCRNKTLARAIEDLSANITISMMTSSNLTTTNSAMAEVTMTPSYNIYQYNSLPLVLSYGIPLLFTTFTVLLGIHTFRSNGVAHSTAFSAVFATTRNPALDGLSKGHSLGSFPLDKEMAKVKLKFGGIVVGEKDLRAGFGLAGEVSELKKWGTYI
ncbi:hypothetical protein N431DRAFT_488253 [Stipitochalara longipes BDJ]|nr:hypothetical protein N431DRAFT_488253 [Stipitochalara longipes BDJ]